MVLLFKRLNAHIFVCINTTNECDHFFFKSGVIFESFKRKFASKSIPMLIFDLVL